MNILHMASKYGNRKTVVDGRVFDSRKEAMRYQELLFELQQGFITELVLQPEYPIVINSVRVCVYVGDFSWKTPEGAQILEDCKGFRTPMYRLKRKLVEASYGIKILET